MVKKKSSTSLKMPKQIWVIIAAFAIIIAILSLLRDKGTLISNDEKIALKKATSSMQMPSTGTPTPYTQNLDETKLWDLINKKRIENGVNPLKTQANLCDFAQDAVEKALEVNRKLHKDEAKTIADANGVRRYHIAQGLGYAPESQFVSNFYNDKESRLMLTGGEYVWGCAKTHNYAVVFIVTY